MNEIFYWTEIRTYTQNFAPALSLYSYNFLEYVNSLSPLSSPYEVSLAWILVIEYTFLWRVIAYIVLVIKEHK
jgi:hypothetical protein